MAPTRVVFEGRRRSAALTLVNTGTRAAVYRVSFVQVRMTASGAFETIEESAVGEPVGERFADDLVRYWPRQVTLPPGVPQTVRLQLRKPAELPPGEYRSHLLLRAIPPVQATGGGVEAPGGTASGLQIRLVPVYGVSVPVIVREGDTAATVRFSDLRVLHPADGEQPRLALSIHRQGNRSVYGDLRVTLVDGVTGAEHIVALAKGLAVYTPNPVRYVELPLILAPGVELTGGLLRVVYRSAEGDETPLASTRLRLK